ncbi:MAG: tRNA preQ1(34) S-adenosylmethionine ribosyltransferase-isomerase QueA [Pirellulales bacterium]|nr:tRNA preQ1(34) S-adenosylmethionine ribosyltransferase-isomerase QueA [Pirellulales bacterium]
MSDLDQYDYPLPEELIAQAPAPVRTDARLLVVDRRDGTIAHRHIRDLPELLSPTDCLVLNDTRVVPARLVGRRTATGGHWEGLFWEVGPEGLWRIMGKTRGKLTSGETITLEGLDGQDDLVLHLGAREGEGVWIVRPETDEDAFTALERVGRVPLPPYIRKGRMIESDRQRYQTVFARNPGAVAAPTAGLHFTEALLRRLDDLGVTLCRVTLHVGLGTFRPIATDTLDAHQMHSEWGRLDEETVGRIESCRANGGRVVAVGTTVVRVLETAADPQGRLCPFSSQTDLFIRPPYEFRAVDVLLTNFHLPKTTLLVLVRTFGGDALIRQAYEEALRQEYRFYSYGDAMLIL